MLEGKRLNAIDLNKQTFSPQHLMSDRDVAKEKLIRSNIEQVYTLMQHGMFDVTIPDERNKEVTATIMMDKQELQDYIDRLNDYYEVSYYEMARLDAPKKAIRRSILQ